MAENRTQEHQLRRALLGELGEQWLERNKRAEERIGVAQGAGDLDGRSFGVRDVEASEVFRLLRFMAPEVGEDPYFQLLEHNHLQRDAVRTLQGKVPDLGMAALMASGFEAGTRTGRIRPATWNRIDDYFDVYDEAGPTQSGMVELVLGLPGSGKTTYLVFRAIEGCKRGFETFADFRVTPTPAGFHEVYQASDLILELVKFARTKPRKPGQVLLGDAGGRGGESKTASTLEARWLMLLLTRARMFRANFARAHQVDRLPDDQRQLVASVVYKDPAHPERVIGEWFQGPRRGSGLVPGANGFEIDRYDSRFDTFAKASMVWNVDMEKLFAYLSSRQGLEDELDVVERFVLNPEIADDDLPEDESSALAAGLPPELAEMPEGGWPVACTHGGCPEEWFYRGQKLPAPGTTIRCARDHKCQLTVALTVRASRDRSRKVATSSAAAAQEHGGPPGE